MRSLIVLSDFSPFSFLRMVRWLDPSTPETDSLLGAIVYAYSVGQRAGKAEFVFYRLTTDNYLPSGEDVHGGRLVRPPAFGQSIVPYELPKVIQTEHLGDLPKTPVKVDVAKFAANEAKLKAEAEKIQTRYRMGARLPGVQTPPRQLRWGFRHIAKWVTK